jgi:drug/metabolite transporter (DMT)-like permease
MGFSRFHSYLRSIELRKLFSPGVKLMLIASMAFAWMNVCVKYIGHVPVFEVILFRALITLVISYAILRKRKVNPWGVNHKFLVARGLFGACGLICYFYTLQQMHLANAIVIHYLSPIFTTLIALFFLGERVRVIQFLAFAVSFTGVIMVKGFANVSTFDFMAGVGGAFFTGLAYNAIRNMKDKEDADVIIFYHPLISLPIVVIYLLVFPQDLVMPHGTDWLFLAGTGVFTQIGQYYITRAYQMDTAARISSVSYIGIIWGVLFGKYLFEDDYPVSVLLGMSVVLSGVFLNLNALKFYRLAGKIRALFVQD